MAAKDINDLQEQVNWHWRNTMRPVRFFNFDARAAIPFLLLIPYFRFITVGFAVFVTLIFWMLERNGLTFASALRRLRRWVLGENRPALLTMRRRKFQDFG